MRHIFVACLCVMSLVVFGESGLCQDSQIFERQNIWGDQRVLDKEIVRYGTEEALGVARTLFNNIDDISIVVDSKEDWDCRFLILLDKKKGQLTGLHMEGLIGNPHHVVTWGTSGCGDRELLMPRSMCVLSEFTDIGNKLAHLVTNRIYVADTGNSRICMVKYFAHGGMDQMEEAQCYLGQGVISKPVAITSLSKVYGGHGGMFYIADADLQSIIVVTEPNTHINTIDAAGLGVEYFMPGRIVGWITDDDTYCLAVSSRDKGGDTLYILESEDYSFAAFTIIEQRVFPRIYDLAYSTEMGVAVLSEDDDVSAFNHLLLWDDEGNLGSYGSTRTFAAASCFVYSGAEYTEYSGVSYHVYRGGNSLSTSKQLYFSNLEDVVLDYSISRSGNYGLQEYNMTYGQGRYLQDVDYSIGFHSITIPASEMDDRRVTYRLLNYEDSPSTRFSSLPAVIHRGPIGYLSEPQVGQEYAISSIPFAFNLQYPLPETIDNVVVEVVTYDYQDILGAEYVPLSGDTQGQGVVSAVDHDSWGCGALHQVRVRFKCYYGNDEWNYIGRNRVVWALSKPCPDPGPLPDMQGAIGPVSRAIGTDGEAILAYAARGEFRFIGLPTGATNISVFDLRGRRLVEQVVNSTGGVDTVLYDKPLPSGSYLLKIDSATKMIHMKILVTK